MPKRLPILQPGGSTTDEPIMTSANAGKRVHMVSLGCPKNRVDTDIMLGRMLNAGYEIMDEAEQADVLMVNTCSFIHDATQESIDTILELAEIKAKRPDVRLVVAGCLAQRHPEELRADLPEVDVFVGTGSVQRVVEAVDRAFEGPVHDPHAFVGTPEWTHGDSEARVNSLMPHVAYLKILEGCPQACSFCIIPTLRGGLRSRPIDALVAEAQALVERGVTEMILVGQDCSSYGYDLGANVRLTNLLERLNEIDGLVWIRVMYLYPARVRTKLLETMAQLSKVVPYVDMPLQHASTSVLKAMNRATTLEKQRDLLNQMRTTIPDLAIRSGFIVGFPGETESDFQQLLEFVEEQQFAHLGVFTFSGEAGTPAATFGQAVSATLASQRRDALMGLQQEISRARNELMIGREVKIVVDGVHPETDLITIGRMATQAPEIDGFVMLNDFEVHEPVRGTYRRAVITAAHDYDLEATVLDDV